MEEEKENDTNLNKEYEEQFAKAKQMKNNNDLNGAVVILRNLYWKDCNYSGLLEVLDQVETEIWKRSSPMNNITSEQSKTISKLLKSTYIQTDPIIQRHEMVSFGVQTDANDSNRIEPRKDEKYNDEDDNCGIIIVKRKIPDYHLRTTRNVRTCLNLSMLDDEEIQIPYCPKRNVVPIP